MMIKFNHTSDGGFVVGDTATGITVYAYPSSEHATKAKKNAEKVAEEMIASLLLSMRFRSALITTLATGS